MDSLYSYAVVLCKNKTEAEDLVQATCLKALENFSQFEPGNFKGWLFTILKNSWLNRSRDLMARNFVDFDESNPGHVIGDSHGVDPERKWESGQIRKAIYRLPEMYREIIVLRDLEGFSYDEIASLLGCPIGTVMSRLRRARTQLRKILEKTFL